MNRQKALMKKYLSRPENQYCADCKRPSPTWASLNIGVFVCIKCSGCHREIGVHITKIKSVELDLWPAKALTDFSKINNEIANAYWEYDLGNYDFQRIRDNELRLLDFIKEKYEYRKWAKPNVPDPMSLVIQGRDLVKEFMNNGEAVKLYEKSQAPELEKRIIHFNKDKNKKEGKSFGILDKNDNNKNINNNINNNNQAHNLINKENNYEIPQNINNNNDNNKSEKKGFSFIKKKQNQNNENNSGINNIFPMDIFSFGQPTNNNNNNNQNNQINQNNIKENESIINNTEPQKPKSGFSFIKNKKKLNTQNNNTNNNTDINDLFDNKNQNINNNINSNNQNINQNIIQNNNIIDQNLNITNNNSGNKNNENNAINLFESDQLVDLFNIETPTSDAVLNLSKNLINIYSTESEENKKNLNNNNMNNHQIPNSNSNYNVLNMNYPNININNYYPNNDQQQNKNKPVMNNNYGMNPLMGFNYPNQGGYMNNNFGFWYGYNMNMNPNYMNMGMGMSNLINNGYNFNYTEHKMEKEKEEQKPILLTNNTFEINLGKDLKKEKEDPFKNLVDFK